MLATRYILAAMLMLGPQAAPARPVVVELFTSQACSSCPPADALLARLEKTQHILALSFNVTYWDSPAWADSFGLKQATERQAWYAGLENSPNVFTPQAVIDGTASAVGSNAGALTTAISAAAAAPAGDIPITITGTSMVTLHIGAGTPNQAAEIWMFGYDPSHTTQVTGGENNGATLTETNIVRSMTDLGPWNGLLTAMTMSHPAGTHIAVLLQTATGAVLGAGTD